MVKQLRYFVSDVNIEQFWSNWFFKFIIIIDCFIFIYPNILSLHIFNKNIIKILQANFIISS